MGACLAMWFAPIVSGPAVNIAERQLIKTLLRTLNADASPQAVDTLFWFARKRMLFFNIGTYVPIVGTALQVMETYAIGQLVLTCTECGLDLQNENSLAPYWGPILEKALSGRQMVEAYEQLSGTEFPANVKLHFLKAVDIISASYRSTEKIPGFRKTQEIAGQGIRQVISAGFRLADRLRGKLIS